MQHKSGFNNYHDDYPWTECTTFEATKKNCPRGESCLKLKKFRNYAWYHNWAMKCKAKTQNAL